MFKRPTKKQLLIRRVLLSIVATFSVVIIVTVTILFMLGYRLDSGNGRLEQGALLQFDSVPGGADVWIDGKQTGNRTASKQTVVAGSHTFLMTRTGYEDWSRTLDLTAGTLTWLDYSRLVPKQRTPQTVSNFTSLVSLQLSPDRKWGLAHETADAPRFTLLDLRAEDVKSTSLTIPATAYSEAATPEVAHTFTVVNWNDAGRYALVRHTYADQTEWLVIDTENIAQTVNITRLLNVAFTDLRFAGTNGKSLYGLTSDGIIRKLDLAGGTISRGLVTNVTSFDVYETNIISYIGTDQADPTTRVAGIYRDGDETPHVLRSTTDPTVAFSIATGRYFSDDYVAIAEGSIVSIFKGTYPSSSTQDVSSLRDFAELELTGAIGALSFSPGGDYVLAQSGTSFASYELEHRRSANSTFTAAEGVAPTTLKWLDTAHLWNDDAGSLTMRDFDGTNAHQIMTVAAGYDSSLSQNGRFFYGVTKTDTGYRFQRVKMILD